MFLDVALDVTTGLVGVAASLKGRVSSGGSDGLLDLALDLVADTLDMGLGIGGPL